MICKLFDRMACFSSCCSKDIFSVLVAFKMRLGRYFNDKQTLEQSEHYPKLEALSTLHIPRWILLLNSNSKLEIYGFADATQKAYATIIYLQIYNQDQVIVALQCAKTRMKPIKTTFIPRLQLCAAQLMAKLMNKYLSSMPLSETKIHL